MDLSVNTVAFFAGSALSETVKDGLKEFYRCVAKDAWQAAKARMQGASNKLITLGLDPVPVTNKLMLPLLKGASIEDEPQLQEMWENLLANAADPRKQRTVEVIFIDTLGKLPSFCVRFLDLLYTDTNYKQSFSDYDLAKMFVKANEGTSEADGNKAHLAIGLLGRLGLLKEQTNVVHNPGLVPEGNQFAGQQEFMTTPMGCHFMNACRPPSKN